MDLLIILYLIFYLVLAKIRLDWAVMLILAALPSYLIRFKILSIPFTLLEAMILVSFFIWFVFRTEFKNFIRGQYGWREFKENRKKRMKYPFGLEIILLLVISFIAVAVAGFSNSALGIWKAYFFEPVLLFILMLNLFKDTNIRMNANDTNNTNLGKILWPLAVSALAVSILAIYQGVSGNLIFNDFWAAAGQRRAVSFFGYPNAVGLYLAPLILAMFGWLFDQVGGCIKGGAKIFNFQFSILKQFSIFNFKTLKLFFIFVTIILSFLAIFFAKSKGALIGITAGLFLFVFSASGKKIKWGMIILVLVAAIGISTWPPLRDYALDKTIYSKSYQIRRIGWQETWKMLKDGRLISGAGLADYQKTVAPYHQEGVFIEDYRDSEWLAKIRASAEFRQKNWQPLEIYLYPHNIFLNFWSELGLAGTLLFIWIIGKYLVLGFRCWVLGVGNKYLVMGLIGAMVVIIVHGLVDVPYFKNDLAVMFWTLIALMSLVDFNGRYEYTNNANDTNKY
ncbi:MAG: O-antigen ligase family protein [Patescibacteria group bacterium]|nr:O-antigen ligase family protein [Patescibacteria group bacterium]MDD5294345.1 O-antigen ligase family protein [Patescibacteria group bacterium]MDD5554038.1 O-antigen ligase family protein [Patescibacteria group bacterium]